MHLKRDSVLPRANRRRNVFSGCWPQPTGHGQQSGDRDYRSSKHHLPSLAQKRLRSLALAAIPEIHTDFR
jgi:hypothetical protein